MLMFCRESGEGWGTGEFGQSMMCEWGLVGRMKE